MQTRYQLKIKGKAARALRQFPNGLRRELLEAIQDLADDPYPPYGKALTRELTGLHALRI